MYDDARRAEARLDNGHIVYARLFPDATKDSGRVPYANKEVIPPIYPLPWAIQLV